MIVIGAFLAALSIGLRSQTVWFTVPLLMLVLFDRVGRGCGRRADWRRHHVRRRRPGVGHSAADRERRAERVSCGARHAGRRGFRRRRNALHESESARARPSRCCGRSCTRGIPPRSATAVLILAAAGIVQLLWRDRRSLAAVIALAGPYLVFHLLFQDTSFIRYALPLVPVVAFLAVRGVSLVSMKAVPAAAAAGVDRVRGHRQPGARGLSRRTESSRPCGRRDASRSEHRDGPARWRCTRRSCGRSKRRRSA